jgi:hypothetical protein
LRWCFAEPNRRGAAIKLTDMREITHYVWVHPGEALRRDRFDRWCFDRRKALFKHREGVPKIVSARCQRNGEQRICDI